MSELEEKLRDELSIAPWETLLPHAERDALICVSSDLNLVEVGVAIASDDASRINEWMSTKKICKPTSEQLEAWNKGPGNFFQFLIVQPYVLITQYFLDSQELH